MKDKLKEIIRDWLMSFDDNTRNVKKILTKDWFREGTDWYEYIVGTDTEMGVQDVIMPIALVIVSLIFIIDFLKITIRMDVLKWEFLLKCFFKLVFARVCIEVSTYVLNAIWTTSITWIDKIEDLGGTKGAGEDLWLHIKPEVDGMGMLALLGFFISTGIMFLVMWVISLVVQVIAYARKFELVIYAAISPLPCAFLPAEDGGSRIAKKFFLSFAALCLQGVFIMMSLKLHGILIGELVEDLFLNDTPITECVGEVLLCTIVLVMAIVKSGGWAKNIFDVAG